jgi:hypothetical protein
MKATITSVDQNYVLATKSVLNFLTFELPSGRRFQVPVDDGVVEAIIGESNQSKAHTDTTGYLQHAPVEPIPSVSRQLDSLFEEAPPANVSIETSVQHVEWASLPDAQLPQQAKNVMQASGVAPVLPREDFERLREQIMAKLSQRQEVGKVDWSSGARRAPTRVARRTVPQDEFGNPIPPGGVIEPDPGETRDEDDDGVQQA